MRRLSTRLRLVRFVLGSRYARSTEAVEAARQDLWLGVRKPLGVSSRSVREVGRESGLLSHRAEYAPCVGNKRAVLGGVISREASALASRQRRCPVKCGIDGAP